MDIGQIIGTTKEPPRRESEPRKEESDDFATFLNEPAPKQEALAKKEPIQAEPVAEKQESAAGKQTEQDAPAEESAHVASRDSTTEAATPVTDQKASATEAKAASVASATPAVPVVPTSVTTAPQAMPEHGYAQTARPTAQSAIETAIDITAAAVSKPNVRPDGKPDTSKAETIPVMANGNPVKPVKVQAEVAAQVAAPAAAAAAAATEKPVKNNAAAPPSAEKAATIGVPEPKPAPTASDVLVAVRTQSEAKMSEKDILSAKIAEMLQDGKGKISLNRASQSQSFQSTLAGSTNLVTASMVGNATTPVMSALPGTANNADGTVPQITPTVSANAGGLPTEATNPTMPTAPTGSVQGVEATATNTASQAANAARASAHLPVAEQVSTQISTAIKEGHDRIKISLHPSELGRVEVKLDIGHDGRVLAVISVDKQETLDMLQRDARTLEKALQDAGFDTGSNGLNFGLRQDTQGEGRNFADLDLPLGEGIDESDFSMLPQQPLSSGINGDGSLDIQV